MMTQNNPTTIGYQSGIRESGEGKFPNPFCDIASEYVPSDLTTIFELCEYLTLTMPPFRSVARRVSRYFLTEIVLDGGTDAELEKYHDFLDNKMHMMQQLAEVGDDFLCLHGDTVVQTLDGPVPIRDLEGRTVDVLSHGGNYRRAAFKAYGMQELHTITFSDGSKIRATADHLWPTRAEDFTVALTETTDLVGHEIDRITPKCSDGACVLQSPVKVISVGAAEEAEIVYCCEEPETHTFVIGNGILTGNCYGQSFISLYFPFDRFLICPDCHMTYHISTIKYKFDKSKTAFIADCKKCGATRQTMKRSDRRSTDVDRVKLIRWNPKEIRLRIHPISGKTHYYMRLDADFVKKVLDGDPFYMDDTPWGMVRACVASDKGQGEHLFRFRADGIYHLKDSTLAGLPIKGWAIPPLFPNFKLAYYVQLLRRYDEAIALDFIIPFRVLFPDASAPGGADPLMASNMGQFVGHMKRMVADHRKNLTDIQISPYKIGYETLGGEAQELAPKDSIALALDELLNSMGFPAELYKGTLTIQAFPVALRIFEKQWNSLVDGYDDLIAWVLRRLNRHFMWGEVTGSLRSVTLADDIERKQLALQAAAGMDISKGTAYRAYDMDFLEEQKRIIEEQTEIQKLQQEAAREEEAQQLAGGGGEGGGEGDMGAPVGATPGDVYEQAKALADQLLFQTPETMRRGELIKIKQSNPTLHALVLQFMSEQRQEMSRQGGAMMMEQAKQASAEIVGYGPTASMPSPVRLGLQISAAIMDYSRRDLMKIAVDVGRGVPKAKEAFSFIYKRSRGWE